MPDRNKIIRLLFVSFILALFPFMVSAQTADDSNTISDETFQLFERDLNDLTDFVTPQMFGALGDGENDDTDALKSCIDYAKTNSCIVFLPMGTYVVRPSVLLFEMHDGESVIIIGSGQDSLIKRKDDSLDNRWDQIFTFYICPETAPAHDVMLYNFGIDSNRRGQDQATDGYEYEHSTDIFIQNGRGLKDSSKQYLDRFVVKNLRFYDPVADCIDISGVGLINIKNIVLDGIVATGRAGTRNDITITAGPLGDVFITNCNVTEMHYEYNASIEDSEIICYHVQNCVFDAFSIAGRLDLICDNIIVKKYFVLGGIRNGSINNSTVTLGKKNYLIASTRNSDIAFMNVTFVSRLLNGKNPTYLYIRKHINCIMRSCTFLYEGDYNYDADMDGESDHVNGSPLALWPGADSNLILDDCKVDDGFLYSVYNDGSGVVMRNMDIDTYYMIKLHVRKDTSNCHMKFENVKLGDQNKTIFYLTSISSKFIMEGEVDCTDHGFYIGADRARYRDSFFKYVQGDFCRTFTLDTPFDLEYIKKSVPETSKHGYPCTFFKGDRFIYNGDEYNSMPDEWIANETGIINAVAPSENNESILAINEIISSVGTGYGNSSERPDCLLSIGYTYFDTDLQMPIYWSGTSWVNATGEEV